MKGKYITIQVRLASLVKHDSGKNVHERLGKTIKEHKRVMQQFIKPVSHSVSIQHGESKFDYNNQQY